MKLCFVTLTGKLPSWLEELSDTYKKKLSYWLPVENIILKTPSLSRSSKEVKLKEEAKTLTKFLQRDDFLVLCDEKGAPFSSNAFSKKLENILNTGKKRVIFLIGG